jgi:hypothetical protein
VRVAPSELDNQSYLKDSFGLGLGLRFGLALGPLLFPCKEEKHNGKKSHPQEDG